MTVEGAPDDAALTTVEHVADTLDAAANDTRAAARRLRRVRTARRNGRRWRDILGDSTARELLDLLGSTSRRLTEATTGVRRAMARALLADGLRVRQIAELIGVSHQRISQVINGDEHRPQRSGSAPDSCSRRR
jgi:transcriptional regulator with XRE-family HTH domain